MSKRSKLLREENNEAEKKLSKETNDILTDIVVYIRNGNISDYSQELVRRDITQMLLDGENRGLSAAEIVGEDYKAFCDAVISEMPQLSPIQRVLTGIRDILPAICAGCAIWTVFSVIGQLIKGEDWTHVPLTVSELITGVCIVLLAVLIVVYITKNVFCRKAGENHTFRYCSAWYCRGRVPADTEFHDRSAHEPAHSGDPCIHCSSLHNI